MNSESHKQGLDGLSATGNGHERPHVSDSAVSALVLVLMAGILLLGLAVRLVGLSDHTMGHNEIYIPGIKLPEDLANPAPRLTLRDTIAGTIAVESHPPGYYVLMLAWTKCFGTSLFSIRLPSVLFDCGTIVLIYVLAACAGIPRSGLLAALIWATGGLATYLAQEARMYPMTCFVGVLSTLLLIKTYSAPRSGRRLLMALYVPTLLAGLSTSHFFWPILLVHVLYTLLGPTADGDNAPAQLRWQLFVVALASPLLAVAAFQSGRESYLSPNVGQQLLGYLCLLFLWSPSDGLPSSQWLPVYSLVFIGPLCLLLLVFGIHRIRRTAPEHCGESIQCPAAVLVIAAVLAVTAIALFAFVSSRKSGDIDWLNYIIGPIVACCAVPLVALTADYLSRRYYSSFVRATHRFGAPLAPAWLAVMLATIPVAILASVSLVIPLMALRTIAIFGPFLVLVLSAGALCIFRSKLRQALVIVGVLVLNVAGHIDYRRQQHSPDDYAGITAQVKGLAQPDDLLFVFRHWAMTPIYYYLDSDSYNFVGRDHAAVIAGHPQARVWVFGFDELSPPEEIVASLSDHRRTQRLSARGMYSDLYVAVSGSSADRPGTGNAGDVGTQF